MHIINDLDGKLVVQYSETDSFLKVEGRECKAGRVKESPMRL